MATYAAQFDDMHCEIAVEWVVASTLRPNVAELVLNAVLTE